MLAVAISGIIGRYLYAQIPRSLNAAELSLTELKSSERELSDALLGQSIFTEEQLARALHVPTAEQMKKISPVSAIGAMIMADAGLVFRVASLRRAPSSFGVKLRSIGGLFSSGNREIEVVVRLVRQKASLSKRVVFLGQTQRVFHLWHVIHRPFSYAFAILAIIHIAGRHGSRIYDPWVAVTNGHSSYVADCWKCSGFFLNSLLARTPAKHGTGQSGRGAGGTVFGRTESATSQDSERFLHWLRGLCKGMPGRRCARPL